MKFESLSAVIKYLMQNTGYAVTLWYYTWYITLKLTQLHHIESGTPLFYSQIQIAGPLLYPIPPEIIDMHDDYTELSDDEEEEVGTEIDNLG